MAVSAVDITKSLSGANFPASKEDIVNHAQDNNASQEVMDILQQIPNKEYSKITDVEHEFSKIK